MKTTQIVVIGGLALTLIGIFFTVALPFFTIQPPPSAAAIDWAKASPQVVRGREIYLREGCFYCHSQQVRFNDETNEALLPDKSLGRPSHESDYVYDAPALLGSERQGPDLRWEGDRQPSDLWHYRHLWNPQLTSAGSIMPGYSYLFVAGSTDAKPLPALDAQALVAYLLVLKTNEALPAAAGAVVAGLTLDTPLPAGNATSGQALFTAQGCNACHSLKPEEKIVGPSLSGLGKTSLTRFKAQDYKGKASSAEMYIKESILNSSAYLVPGYPDAMLKDYPQKLNAQQLADIIAFLQTQ